MSKLTDDTMRNVWISLHDEYVREGFICPLEEHLECLQNSDMVGFRKLDYPSVMNADFSTFMAIRQLSSLFDRYTFTEDATTSKERKDRSLSDFIATQEHLRLRSIDQVGHRILRRMRHIMREILTDEVPYVEIAEKCNHGRRSAVGLTREESCHFERRFSDVSGTKKQKRAFRAMLSGDNLLAWLQPNSVRDLVSSDDTSSLCAVAVPKKWKVDRIIMPNTISGAYVTAGVGNVIQDRLCSFYNINLSTQPDLHKVLAQRSSITRHLVTADLSRASDMITREHVRLCLPEHWFSFLDALRVPNVEIDGKVVGCVTFMTMGVGYTFPLQTLYFRVLLDALMQEFGIRGRCSVYGDDLIYPRRLHKYVLWAFKHLNHDINKDKTFVEHHFRESCGGDFYHGEDVRPVKPKNQDGSGVIDDQRFLYKLFNALNNKYYGRICSCPKTLSYILGVLQKNFGEILQVPVTSSEDAGILVSYPRVSLFGHMLRPVHRIDCCTGDARYYYVAIKERMKYRKVDAQWPYLWEALRTGTQKSSRYTEDQARLIWRKPSDPKKRKYCYQWDWDGRRVKVCIQEPHIAIPSGSYRSEEIIPLW